MIVNLNLDVKGGLCTCEDIGPKILPYGIDLNKLAEEINQHTKMFVGMRVNINLKIDSNLQKFWISLPKPKSSDLIKKYSKSGTITLKDLEDITNIISSKNSKEKQLNALKGTCKSMHIKII